jgi:hypothetical protein
MIILNINSKSYEKKIIKEKYFAFGLVIPSARVSLHESGFLFFIPLRGATTGHSYFLRTLTGAEEGMNYRMSHLLSSSCTLSNSSTYNDAGGVSLSDCSISFFDR